jgi:hypothetical protein
MTYNDLLDLGLHPSDLDADDLNLEPVESETFYLNPFSGLFIGL